MGTVGSQDILLSQAGPCLSSRFLQVHPEARTGGSPAGEWDGRAAEWVIDVGSWGSVPTVLWETAENVSAFSSWLVTH